MGKKQRPEMVSYKGRPYRCTWRGKGKFGDGERAKLEFMDGSKSFYVDAALLEPYVQSDAARERAEKKQCWECGREFTYAECKTQDGDWSDSYCGC